MTDDRVPCTSFNAATDYLKATKISAVQVNMVKTGDVVSAIKIDRRVADLYNDLSPDKNNNFVNGYMYVHEAIVCLCVCVCVCVSVSVSVYVCVCVIVVLLFTLFLVFCFSCCVSFTFWEQYLHIEDELLRIAAWSLLGVFMATLIFQFSIVLSLILVAVILMIDIEIYGMIDVRGAVGVRCRRAIGSFVVLFVAR